MGTTTKIILVGILGMWTSGLMIGQTTKDIHLMHGLSGDNGSWAIAKAGLEQNCTSVNVTIGSYESTDGIQAYLDDFIPNVQAVGSPDDIAIAHSFGTLAARSLGVTNLFGGYISVAGPHGGAQLATSVLDGTLENYLEGGCDAVVQKPSSATATLFSFGVLPVAANGSLDLATQWFCNGLFEIALAIEGFCLPFGIWCVGAPFTGQDMQSIRELQPGDAASQLPPAAIPAIAIRSDLESPVHWNLMKVTPTMQGISAVYRDIASVARGIASVVKPKWWLPLSWATGGFREVSLDVETGRQIWRTETGGSPSPIVYHDGRIYMSEVTQPGGSSLLVIDALTGEILYDVVAPYDPDVDPSPAFNDAIAVDPQTGYVYTGNYRDLLVYDFP